MSFTLMPFLYQTRTILRSIPPRRASATALRSLHATARHPRRITDRGSTIPFDYEVGQPEEDIPVADAPSRGTITPSERRIFERIFADIEARGLQPAVGEDGEPVSPEPRASRSARLVMQQAAYDAGQAGPATVTAPAVLSGAAKDRAKALLRFPPELRGAASRALDTIKQQALKGKRDEDAAYDVSAVAAAGQDDALDDHWSAPAYTFARTIELEAKRQHERTRIEGLITSATSDFELWDVLEREVFTMPARLGIVKGAAESDDSDLSPESSKRGRKRDRNSATESPGQASNDAEPDPETFEADSTSSDPDPSPSNSQGLNLYIHGPLYPAYLLLALRRLDTAFCAPSPLVFSILPRIKELGLESYVLGVSTPFFNELLTIYWTRRGDLSGILELLEEMRHCGLYFDARTAAILNRVDTAINGLALSRSGLGQALLLMPEFEKLQRERIRHWHRTVDMSARERKDDFGFAEATSV
ncbi:hypothetical protein F5Y10DRAFT_273052 [Nemania abortiva]|nr:hypothetical protein F5Y10DRAFT_273052 [Nemania abortiva]